MAQGIMTLCLCSMVLGASPVHAQSNDIMNRISRLENELDTLNRAVYKGETPPPPAAYSGGPLGASGGGGNIEIRLQQLEDDLRSLTGQIEEQSFDIQQMKRQVEIMSQNEQRRDMAQPMAPPKQVYNATPSSDMDVAPTDPIDFNYNPPQPGMKTLTPAPAALAAGDPAAAYEQAFSLVKAGDYAAAEAGFDSFLKSYPDHALASNAKYWLGETYYVRQQYDQAARVFAEAYQKYPKGPKAADNLLKLGMSLAGQGKKDDACIALAQISIEYPNGPAPVMSRAKQEMNNIGCP